MDKNSLAVQSFEERISYVKLLRHIENHHPCKNVDSNKVKFNFCDHLGSLPFCCCGSRKVSEMAQQIGIGPTLFLMSTKALSWFFFFLTLVNAPVFLLYYYGHENSNLNAITTIFA